MSSPGRTGARDLQLLALEIAAEAGAVLGLNSVPLVVWVMLPRVPLGRVFLWLTPSAVLGGIFGWFAFSSLDVILGRSPPSSQAPCRSAFATPERPH